MKVSSNSLGVSKYRKSGKSLKARMVIELHLRKEERKNQLKKREVNCRYSSVDDLFSNMR